MKKRALLLLLALTYALSLHVLAAPADPAAYTDADQITYQEAVDTLSRLGVFQGRDDGSFDPKGLVTRGECAKLLAAMRCGGDSEKVPAEIGDAAFSDTEGHWAEKYISFCAELGILNGRGNGSFDPDAPVTGIELAKIALAGLGYDPVVYLLTGPSWDTMTNRLALQLCDPSLYEGLGEEVSVSEPITREVAAQILYNMLDNSVKEAIPDTTSYPGEVIHHYGTKRDENNRPVSFLSLYFPGKELGDILSQPKDI